MLLRRQHNKLDFGPELKTWANSLHEIILASAKAFLPEKEKVGT